MDLQGERTVSKNQEYEKRAASPAGTANRSELMTFVGDSSYPDVLMRLLNQLLLMALRQNEAGVFAAASNRSPRSTDIFFSRFSSQDRAEHAQGVLRAT